MNWLLTSERDAQSGDVLTSTTLADPLGPARTQSSSGRKKRRRKVSKGDCVKGQASPVLAKAPDHQPPAVGDALSEPPSVDTKPSTQEVLKEVGTASPLVADSSQVQQGVTQDQTQVKENRASKELQSAFPVTDGGVKVKVAWKTVGRLVSPSGCISSLKLFVQCHSPYTCSQHTSVDFQKIQHEQASSTVSKLGDSIQ